MEPTLLVGDHILVNKFIYGFRIPYTNIKVFQFKKPQRGDICVFIFPLDPSKDFIKRVIATEGEMVQIIDNKTYINNKQIKDPWGHHARKKFSDSFEGVKNFGPALIPKDSLFVLGDNRDNSQDSRSWGFVNVHTVKGKAFMIYFSWDRYAENLFDKVRWTRIGKLIH